MVNYMEVHRSYDQSLNGKEIIICSKTSNAEKVSQMSRKASLILVTLTCLLPLWETIGCGPAKVDVSGIYVSQVSSKVYIELKSDGTFDAEWGVAQALSYPSSGTWWVEEGAKIVLSDEGFEAYFGEVKGERIVDRDDVIYIKSSERGRGAAPVPSAPTKDESTVRLAFGSVLDGDQEVYIINADGTGQTNLTKYPHTDDGDPASSPDGRRIAFSSNRDGHWRIYTMDIDGSNQVCLLQSVYDAWGPAWSPDGRKIVFACQLNPNDDFEIYTIDIQNKALTQLTDDNAEDSHPAWSPDGQKIVFTSKCDGNHELYVMNVDGSNQTRLTNNLAYDDYPEWSPGGNEIAFISERDGNLEIYSMNIMSKTVTRLTYNEASDKHAQWSPGGEQIIFVSDRDGDFDIYLMNADGTNEAQITNLSGDESHPTWVSARVEAPMPPTFLAEPLPNGIIVGDFSLNLADIERTPDTAILSFATRRVSKEMGKANIGRFPKAIDDRGNVYQSKWAQYSWLDLYPGNLRPDEIPLGFTWVSTYKVEMPAAAPVERVEHRLL